MRHLRVEGWARGSSAIHQLHPAVKIVSAVVILVCVSSATRQAPIICLLYLSILLGLTYAAKLRPVLLLTASAKVLPFALFFALISLLSGEQERAVGLLARSFTSSYCALLLIGTTEMPSLIRGLETLRVPGFLLLVMQFLFRYLVVLFGEAAALRDAGASRGGSLRNLQFRQAGAAAGVLFARSYHRAQAIHQAMISRGFTGHIPTLTTSRFQARDAIALSTICLVSVVIRLAIR